MSDGGPGRPPDQMPEGDTDRKHGEQLLQILTAGNEEQNRQFVERLNAAHQQWAEANKQ
jgi:hypothetical protein